MNKAPSPKLKDNNYFKEKMRQAQNIQPTSARSMPVKPLRSARHQSASSSSSEEHVAVVDRDSNSPLNLNTMNSMNTMQTMMMNKVGKTTPNDCCQESTKSSSGKPLKE